MCGIGGELRFDDTFASPEKLQVMMDSLAPRGPDAAGLFTQGRVGFGHRRLKVIDLSEKAQQPMVDSVLGLTLVFNGCLYNHRDLRRELETLGYRFFSEGDTEVLLKAWHAWGEQALPRLNGMFAFAVLERDSGMVTLVRDRLGIKPLYWAQGPGWFRFASTLPAVLAAGGVETSVDPVGLHHYMMFHAVVPAPHTILTGVRKMLPGSLMRIAPDGTRQEKVWWRLTYQPEEAPDTVWEDRVLDTLRTAVRRRLVADVPVGVLLSGGLDSSLLVGLIAEAGECALNTFSVGFEAVNGEQGDEFRYSDLIARHYGTEHHRLFVPSADLLGALPACIAAMSEPMVSHDAVGFYLLSQAVSQTLKVVQSGQGADEVFAGYHWYPPLQESRDAVSDYARVFCDRDQAEFEATVHPRFHGGDFSRDFIRAHFDRPGAETPLDKALRMDTTVMLVDDPVKRVDTMTMAWGLEARVPFLDHELVELAARMPARLKLADGGKGVLKAVGRKVIPREVIDRPKGYFPVPALKYLEGASLAFVRDVLDAPAARERALFSPQRVQQLMAEPKAHLTPLRGSKLWQLALLEAWLQTHVDGAGKGGAGMGGRQ